MVGGEQLGKLAIVEFDVAARSIDLRHRSGVDKGSCGIVLGNDAIHARSALLLGGTGELHCGAGVVLKAELHLAEGDVSIAYIDGAHSALLGGEKDIGRLGLEAVALDVLEIELGGGAYVLHSHKGLQAALLAEDFIYLLLGETEGQTDGVPALVDVAIDGEVNGLLVIGCEVLGADGAGDKLVSANGGSHQYGGCQNEQFGKVFHSGNVLMCVRAAERRSTVVIVLTVSSFYSGGGTGGYGERRDAARYDSSGPDHGPLANGNSGQHGHSRSDEHVILNANDAASVEVAFGRDKTEGLGISLAKLIVGDEHIGAYLDIAANLNLADDVDTHVALQVDIVANDKFGSVIACIDTLHMETRLGAETRANSDIPVSLGIDGSLHHTASANLDTMAETEGGEILAETGEGSGNDGVADYDDYDSHNNSNYLAQHTADGATGRKPKFCLTIVRLTLPSTPLMLRRSIKRRKICGNMKSLTFDFIFMVV